MMMWHKGGDFISDFPIKAGSQLKLCFVVAWQQNTFFQQGYSTVKPSTLGRCQVSVMAFDRLDLWKIAGFFPFSMLAILQRLISLVYKYFNPQCCYMAGDWDHTLIEMSDLFFVWEATEIEVVFHCSGNVLIISSFVYIKIYINTCICIYIFLNC